MPDFKNLLGQARAKAEGFAKQHNIPNPFPGQPSQHQQAPPNNYYPPPNSNYQYQQPPPNSWQQQQQNPPNNYYPGNNQPPYQQQPPPPNGYYPPHDQQHQQHQQHQQPPTPNYNSRPQNNNSSYAPPIPSNKPGTPPVPANKPNAASTTYWTPSFSPSIPVSQNFKHQTGAHGWGNNELQNYIPDPANSFHTPDNKLVLRAISTHGQYTSARLTSHQTLSRQRGSLIAVASPPCAAGIWPALWLLPSEPFQWPNEAEIDILETWNADNMNHSCLHWGHFNGEDWNKHRVADTPIGDMASGRPIRYEFSWWQDESAGRNTGGGRGVWYIDGRAVMKAEIPPGARRISDWQVIINVAMGGNVCQGRTPADGHYDFVIHELRLCGEPTGGWSRFEADWHGAPEGHH